MSTLWEVVPTGVGVLVGWAIGCFATRSSLRQAQDFRREAQKILVRAESLARKAMDCQAEAAVLYKRMTLLEEQIAELKKEQIAELKLKKEQIAELKSKPR